MHLTSHAHTLSGQQELPKGHRHADEDSTETLFQTAAKTKETDSSICGAPVRTKAKALCPRSDPFDGRMQSEQADRALPCGYDFERLGGSTLSRARRTHHRGDA